MGRLIIIGTHFICMKISLISIAYSTFINFPTTDLTHSTLIFAISNKVYIIKHSSQ